MYKAFKFRIYPNTKQIAQIEKTFAAARFVYNKMLEDKIAYYNENKKMLKNHYAAYKKDNAWLSEVDCFALVYAESHLKEAFNRFFKMPSIGFPKFKSCKAKNSYTTYCREGRNVIGDKVLNLPKVKGPIKVAWSRKIPKDYIPKSITISRTPSNKYFASIDCEYDLVIKKVEPKTFLNIEPSEKELYIDNLGNEPEYIEQFTKLQEKLKKEQRKLSKMQLGSNNYEKQRIKLARIHEHIANKRKDWLHKHSRALIDTFDDIKAEQELFSSHNGYYTFLEYLNYKAIESGKHFEIIS